jgi:hypothetical protein
MSPEKTDPIDLLYRDQIDQFSAYVRLKEVTGLAEGFFSSGQLVQSLKVPREWRESTEFAVGLTGSIGRREAHTAYSDYDVSVIAKSRDKRDAVIKKLIELNPQACEDKLERSSLFGPDEDRSPNNEELKDIYYPLIESDTILQPEALMQRVWFLTEFTPLVASPVYRGLQRKLAEHYGVFTKGDLYANPKKLLDDLLKYRDAFNQHMKQTEKYEREEMKGMGHHAKTIFLRQFAHLFNALAVVRLVCRKDHILALPDDRRDDEFFANLRAPTLIRLGYWFSDEFHFSRSMRRFDVENKLSSSIEVRDRYMKFLRDKSPGSRGKVIEKLCTPLENERGMVRRLFKRTSVELIESYNEGLKRLWLAEVREHLAGMQPGNASDELEGVPEILNMKELSLAVLWPLRSLAELISTTFEVAGEWGYFEGQTYPYSGRAESTKRLVKEAEEMKQKVFPVRP